MGLLYVFKCSCGYKLDAMMFDGGLHDFRTYRCNTCKDYFVAKLPLKYKSASLPAEERNWINISAIAFYDENEQIGKGFRYNDVFCQQCGGYDLELLTDKNMLNGNDIDSVSKIECPVCGKKLIYKSWGVFDENR